MFEFKKRDLLIDKRKEQGVSQMRVAAELGISQTYYSNVEMGYVKPNKKVAEKLVSLFGLPTDYFTDEK